jgi:hypothetical protein
VNEFRWPEVGDGEHPQQAGRDRGVRLRSKSQLVEDETYFWSVSRYIHLMGPITDMESVSINWTAARLVAG